MKLYKLVALIAFVAICAVMLFAPDAARAATLGGWALNDHGHGLHLLQANAALLAMRTQHTDLMTRAAAKIKEIVAGMSPEAIKTIEDDHADLVRQAKEIETKIAAEETRAVPPAPKATAWSADDIAKIRARATAFGLTADDALKVMEAADVRSVEQATDKLQDMAASRTAPRQHPQVRITQDEGDTLRRSMENAIILRANPQALPANAAERDMARNYRGMRLLEMGRIFVEESQGVRLRNLSSMQLASVLMGLERAAGMQSTSDFGNLLANVASKRLRDAYAASPQTFKLFCRQSNNPDFKEKSVVQLSSAPSFKQVREGQEYSYGGLTDGVEKYALATYGRIIAITRTSLINDDLGAFDRLPTMHGRAAADLESSTVYNVLLANAPMNDGVALFHANHGNLMTGSVIDDTNLALADKAMRDQKSLAKKAADQEPLNLIPRFLITGNAKRVEAQKMVTAITPSAAGDVNVWQGALQPVTEARVTGNQWFLSADPASIDTIEYSYLEGEEGVFVEQRVGFEVDGIELKGRLDFAAKAIDWRGMVKNPGN